jgi:hypothetical protein
MSDKIWTLKYDGEEKPLAEWGIRAVKLRLTSQAIDALTFVQPAASDLDDPLFEEGGIVELFRDDERWFYGRAEDAEGFGSGRAAGCAYTISGPWWWLANMGFRQTWKVRSNGVLVDQFSSYCLLGSKADGLGTQQSIKDQIAEALNYAISQDAPLAFDLDGLPACLPPVRDAWNLPVADVIKKMIEWAPDIVTWFDYSTEPYPTLRMRRRENVEGLAKSEAVLLNLASSLKKDGYKISERKVRPRSDLKVPGVVIYYIRTDTANGSVYSVINEEKYPAEVTGREPKALLAAINLEGANVTYLETPIDCVAIEPQSADWWKLHDGHLQSPTITELTIKANSATYTTEDGEVIANPLPRELFGTWATWMGGSVQSINVRALASWKEKRDDAEPGEDPLITVKDRPINCTIWSTDLNSGTYKSAPSGQSGEAQPVGLAETLYRAASVLHFQGSVVVKEEQCSGRVKVGNVLNLDNGRTAWKEMRAQIQEIVEEIDTGSTTVVFGPPQHLGPADYMELLRATHNRLRFASPASRSTGIAGSSSAITGKTISKQVATSGHGGVTQQQWVDPRGEIPGKVNLNLSEAGGKEIKLREITVCDNGVERKMIVLASASY